MRRPKDPNSDFAAVGNQKFANGFIHRGREGFS
jgi:hypothetical protein